MTCSEREDQGVFIVDTKTKFSRRRLLLVLCFIELLIRNTEEMFLFN